MIFFGHMFLRDLSIDVRMRGISMGCDVRTPEFTLVNSSH